MTRTQSRALGFTACAAALLMLAAALLHGAMTRAAPAAATTATVADAWVRLPAVPGRPGAAYLTLNGGKAGDKLVEVSSPLAGRVELHSTEMQGGIMKMSTLDNVVVAPGKAVAFAPGGNHLMLFGLDAGVKPGGSLPLALRFASGATLLANAKVVAAGAPAPYGKPAPMPMDHQHQ